MTEYEVHEAADVWPMIPSDEMKDLAKSIKAIGLRHPIVIQNGKVVDGRNRLAACKLAGVEPVFEKLPNDVDVYDFIDSSNLNRRHMTLGARIMASIRMRPESLRGKKNKSQNGDSFLTPTERNYRSKARVMRDEVEDYIRRSTGQFPEADLVEIYKDHFSVILKDPGKADSIAMELSTRRATALISKLKRRATSAIQSDEVKWTDFTFAKQKAAYERYHERLDEMLEYQIDNNIPTFGEVMRLKGKL